LQQASATQSSVAFEVYELIPANPTHKATGLDNSDIAKPPFFFTWLAFSKSSRLPDKFKGNKKAEKYLHGEKFYRDKAITNGFKLYRDIPIATSVNFGRINYTLWASGRITENFEPDSGDTKGRERKEIEPPFEFLFSRRKI